MKHWRLTMIRVASHPRTELEMINGNFKGKDIVSLAQFSAQDLHLLFPLTTEMKQIALNNEPSYLLAGTVVSLLFFEPSSRTFGSFAAAVKRLGGETIEIQNAETTTSCYKGESFEDTIRTFEAYSNAIVLRHKLVGSAERRIFLETAISGIGRVCRKNALLLLRNIAMQWMRPISSHLSFLTNMQART